MSEHDGIEPGANSGFRAADGNPSSQESSPGASAYATPASSSVGATLRAGREQRNWSQEEVSVRLKFGVRQIAALEEERWGDLPHGMSLRGFVRNYARILDLPPEPLLQALAPRLETGDPVSLTQASSLSSPLAQSSGRSSWPGTSSRKRPAPWIIGGVMVIIAVVLLGYALVQQGKFPSITGIGKAKDTTAPVVTPPATTEEVIPPNTTPLGESPTTTSLAPESVAPPVPASAMAAAPAVADVVAPPVTTGGLVVLAHEESWLEVRRGNGTVAIAQNLPAKGDFRLEAAAAPLRVVIGNVKGVDVSWRDQPVDLTSARRDNVARLTLN